MTNSITTTTTEIIFVTGWKLMVIRKHTTIAMIAVSSYSTILSLLHEMFKYVKLMIL